MNVIALVILLLFGGKKIPELMRGLGKGMNEFKKAKDENTRKKITAILLPGDFTKHSFWAFVAPLCA